MSDKPNIIIDNGTGYCKAVFSSLVGRPKNQAIMSGAENKYFYVGLQAEEKRGILNLNIQLKMIL